jgi:hypothetical protein
MPFSRTGKPSEALSTMRFDDPTPIHHRYRRSEIPTIADELGNELVKVLASEPRSVPDVYFGEGYGRADAHAQGGTWISIADPSGAWQMPLSLAELGGGLREAVSPYGYSGIHVADDMTLSDAADAWSSARECLESLRVVSLFLRFSPLGPDPMTIAGGLGGLTVERSRTTYMVAIGEPGRMWEALRSSCRSRIRKARKNGYVGEVREAQAEDLKPGGAFRRLYEETMTRRAAATHYFFGDDYYAGLLDGLDTDLFLAEVQGQDGSAVSSCLLMRHGQRLHYHLAGSSTDGAQMGSNNLMLWTATEFAWEQGLTAFHLGGGRADHDGLARFKSTFGGETRDFYTGRAVIDADAYSRLTAERADKLGTTVAALQESDYFPAFRASAG